MDKLLDTLSQYLQQAQSVITKYGPHVWDATLAIVRANAIFNLAVMFVVTLATVIMAWKLLPFLYRKCVHEDSEGWIVAAVIASVADAVGIVASIVLWICSFPDWLGALNPAAGVLYKIASKAGIL